MPVAGYYLMTSSPPELFPITQATVDRAYEFVFAPWSKKWAFANSEWSEDASQPVCPSPKS